MEPSGAVTTLTLALPREGQSAGIVTRVVFNTEDVDADHADLRERGVDVDDAIMCAGDPVVSWGGAIQAGIARYRRAANGEIKRLGGRTSRRLRPASVRRR